ncbi:MAG: ISL3 family transposase [Actinomycetota bacterium]|nr:ISL3 family transposase [Actinomycetota bacterium]
MREARVWAGLLGLQRAVVEGVYWGSEGELVVAVRPSWRERDRCGACRRRSPGFDLGDGRRRWRTLDLGTTLAFVEAAAPRVTCRRHGVVVCAVPWARHSSRFTRAFEDQAAWLAVNTSKTAVAQLMRVAWRSVGQICARVAVEAQRDVDLLSGLRRIGIDEISHRRGQRYLTVVVCHDSGRLVWAAAGRDRKTVEAFFDQLGEERCKQVELVSCDMAGWISGPVAQRLPDAVRCVDPFHVVMLATDALDEIRREVWNDARRAGEIAAAKDLKGARYALWKNPENLTDRQTRKLASVQKTNRRLYRAYLLKEQLRQIYRLPAGQAIRMLDEWIAWARRCRLAPFVKLAKTISTQRGAIVAAIKHGLSNARVEAINTQIRLITRRAFGFHSPGALIALAMLSLANLCPPLPR